MRVPRLLLLCAAAAACDEQCESRSHVLVQRSAVLSSSRVQFAAERAEAAAPQPATLETPWWQFPGAVHAIQVTLSGSTSALRSLCRGLSSLFAGDTGRGPALVQHLTVITRRDDALTGGVIAVMLLLIVAGAMLLVAVALCLNFGTRLGPRQEELVRGHLLPHQHRQPLPPPRLEEEQAGAAHAGATYVRSTRSAAAPGAQPEEQQAHPGASARSLLVPSLLPASAAPSAVSLRPSVLRPPGSRFTFGGSLREGEAAAPRPAPPPLPLPRGSEPAGLFPTARQPERTLCPCLVVPEGMELVFAVRDLLTRLRQQISFSVVDLEGTPLSHVIVNEVGQGERCGILLRMLDQTPLAWVRTGVIHEEGGLPEICFPSGEVFCVVGREDAVPTGRYTLRDRAGQRLYTFHGDFREKAVNVVSSSGRLVCDTERCELGYDGSPHYQVRVAPSIDAGLILCGLLAVEKLEGALSAPQSARPTGHLQ